MKLSTLAHLSDLHLGRSAEVDEAAARLCEAVIEGAIDHVVVTGDVTHRGRRAELDRFFAMFGGLLERGRLSVVPGNHDRLGDDVGARIMRGGRVEVARADGLYLVRIDTTGPHNRFLLAGHGEICERVLAEVELALEGAPPRALVALLLHHHPLPLPEETLPERISSQLGWPWAMELRLGQALVERVRGRCDLILHGHRHVPRAFTVGHPRRPFGLFNAGSSTELGRFRVFHHLGGTLLGEPFWVDTRGARASADLATGTEGP